jgi:methionine biosynthesis protein MetW
VKRRTFFSPTRDGPASGCAMASIGKLAERRTVDMRILGEWVETGSRVCELGCGRGVLLEYLVHTHKVFAVGVDLDVDKIAACVKRGVNAYQGDMMSFLRKLPDGFFDRVVFSRTIEELPQPAAVLREALRVGRCVTVGFVNHAYWKNRLGAFLHGRKLRNEVYTTDWSDTRPTNPVAVADFEEFCAAQQIRIVRRAVLRGDWERPCTFLPNLRAGYAMYEIAK